MRTKATKLDGFISWARCLYWAELNRARFFEETGEPQPADTWNWKWWAFMSQFYASLWVVVEGWKALKLRDPDIDFLISHSPNNCKLLKQFRDSVYHCTPHLLDPRTLAFGGDAVTFWANALHEEFQRYYWEWPERSGITPEQVNEMRSSMLNLVGWIPTELMRAQKHDIKKICDDAERMLSDDGDFSSPHARDLLKVIEGSRKYLQESPDKIFLPEYKKLISRRPSNDGR